MRSTDSDRDPERDAWLDAALRHAPDAGAGPPAAVRDAILREARAAPMQATGRPAARAGAARAPGGIGAALGAFWDWLARPAVAAGFASVLAATVIALMWWDRPLDATLERPPLTAAAPATIPASPASADSAISPPPTTGAEREVRIPEVPSQPPVGMSPMPPPAKLEAPGPRAPAAAADARSLRRQAVTPAGEAAREARATGKVAAPQSSGEEQVAQARSAAATTANAVPAGAERGGASSEALDKGVGNAAPPSITAQAPTADARMARPAPVPVPDAALAKSRRAAAYAGGAAETEARNAAVSGQAPQGELASRRKDAPEPFPSSSPGLQGTTRDRAIERSAKQAQQAERSVADATAGRPSRIAPATPGPAGAAMGTPVLASLRDRIAAEPARWSWSRDDGATRAATDELQEWLARADATTRIASPRAGTDAAARADSDAGATAPAEPATTLRLYRDGRLQASLRVDAAGLETTDAAGAVQRVPLEAADRAALRTTMPR